MPSCRFRGWCAVKKVGNVLFNEYLLFTNLGSSIVLTGVADITEQKIMNRLRKKEDPWDMVRTGRMVLLAGVCGGLASHFWFHFLERRIPGQSFHNVMAKVWLDQMIFSPIYTLLLFASLDLVENASIERLKSETREKALFLIVSEIIVMPPLQMINFYFFKPKYRVLFDYLLSVVLSGFTSFVKYDFYGFQH